MEVLNMDFCNGKKRLKGNNNSLKVPNFLIKT